MPPVSSRPLCICDAIAIACEHYRYADGGTATSMGATDKFTKAVTSPGRWPLYLGFLVGLAAVEELLWEV